jgi:hypothetical protein
MTTRFCPGCRSEVEDTGGFCLLGHRLALEAPVASLTALRAEVDDHFESSDLADALAPESFGADTDTDVAATETLASGDWDRIVEPVMAGAVAAPPTPRRVGPPPPPPPLVKAPAPVPVPVAAPLSPPPPAPVAPARRVPPPPPPPPPVLPSNPASPLYEDRITEDPIASFAPAPRMDWGPEKGRLKRLARRKRDPE